ncbi:MAG: heavy metal-associated domain-containing protein [Vicingaceae bacterium]
MKRSILALTMLISVFVVNCNQASEESVKVLADQELALKVDGMVCAVGCAKYIEKQVAKMDGVSKCEVDFEKGTASIVFSSSVLSKEAIVESISDMNGGQYKVNVTGMHKIQNNTDELPEGSQDNEPSVSEVTFHFPELVTFFIGQLTR